MVRLSATEGYGYAVMIIENVKATIEANKKYKTGKIREQNYQVILDAAEKIFSASGFKGASMMAIANEAGLPKANVHYYFKNKSLLYAAVLEQIMMQWNDGLEEISVDDDPKEVLSNYILHKTKLACENPQMSKLFSSEIIAGAPYLKDYIREQSRPWLRTKLDIFEAWMAAGKMRQIDPEKLIFLIWSSTEHYADYETQVLLLQNKIEYTDADIQSIAAFLIDVVLAYCGL